MEDDEKELWTESIRAELKPFEDLKVFDEVTPEDVRAMKQKGSYPKKLPARLILVKKPSAQHHNGWKRKARVVCCGNFEE
eukprot:10069348-Prorocentrum_lima.AAC.1